MQRKSVKNRRGIMAKLGIGCVIGLLLVCFGVILHAQDKTKAEFIGTKEETDWTQKSEANAAKMETLEKMKESIATRNSNRSRARQSRGKIDFGDNAAFYEVIIENNLFRPLGWTPPNNEPTYSLVGTVVGTDGAASQATLLERRSNRYHFVTIGTKLDEMTVTDIQAKQVTLDKEGEPVTLRAGGLQFLSSQRGGSRGSQPRGGSSEQAKNTSENNQSAAKMDADKLKQMEMQKQGGSFSMSGEFAEKFKAASPEERREMMREMRRRGGGTRGDRGGRGGGRRGRD